MKRQEILDSKFKFNVPDSKKVRVIVHADAKNEADDQFAIVHHLLTPSFEIAGIIAGHYGIKFRMSQNEEQPVCSMSESYTEIDKLLHLMGMNDIPVQKGATGPIDLDDNLQVSEGADFIVEEAMKDDERPLFVALQGCLTDLALAYRKNPQISNRLTAIWIGGGDYPLGGNEFNMYQDVRAAQIVFDSSIPIWQIPMSTYRQVEASLAEIQDKVHACGPIGRYLFEQLVDFNTDMGLKYPDWRWPHGETWCLGDQPTITVLLYGKDRCTYHMEYAPIIGEDMTYEMRTEGKQIRVYDYIDVRMTMEDFYSKLRICYG